MTLQLGDTAPDFTAESTEGTISFHDWVGDSWAMMFSHPKDFTPVCTTELGYVAKLKPEFDKRNVKIIGLSVDSVDDHVAWSKDIEETQGHAPNYPMIGDSDLSVAKLYGMIHPNARGVSHALGRPPLGPRGRAHAWLIPCPVTKVDTKGHDFPTEPSQSGVERPPEPDDLDVPLVEFGLELRHIAEFGGADRREVLGV